MKLSREDFVQLFEISCLGSLASAFYHTQTEPTTEQWQMIRGEREITMRDMGGISFSTCLEFNVNMTPVRDVDLAPLGVGAKADPEQIDGKHFRYSTMSISEVAADRA